jgi:hypothetical protein
LQRLILRFASLALLLLALDSRHSLEGLRHLLRAAELLLASSLALGWNEHRESRLVARIYWHAHGEAKSVLAVLLFNLISGWAANLTLGFGASICKLVF